ncbi:MAG: hypothetical protein J6N21_16240, partial [Butyrivibrio sp.]|nr:hypothetical protein [Butyrivibrio sp.]
MVSEFVYGMRSFSVLVQDICRASAILYNRANFILRQYSSAVDSMALFKPLFPNQMMVYRLVR